MKRQDKMVDDWEQELYWYDFIPFVGMYTMRNVPSTLRLNANEFLAYVTIQATSPIIFGMLLALIFAR